jgi:hypothetical protein
MLAIVAAAALVTAGHGIASGHGSPASAPRGGVDIQQSYDRHGNPAVIANAGVPGDTARPVWSVCPPPDTTACTRVAHPEGSWTSAFIQPGTTIAGTVFEARLMTGGRTYIARTGTWLGTVRTVSAPTLTGPARFSATVVPHRARWSGGWAALPTAAFGPTSGPASVDVLNVEACRTPAATHCVNLTAQGSVGFSRRPPVVDNWFTGWYLFAFDQRDAVPLLIAQPGYGTPSVIPTVKVGATAARSAPLGPVTGPPPPRVSILRTAILARGDVLVARVRCAVRCRVSVSVDDRRTGSFARVTLTRRSGSALVGVARRQLRRGRLDVIVQVGAGPQLTARSRLEVP